MIIRRYVFREIVTILFALTALLLLIYISHRFMSYLVQAANGALPVEFILQLLSLKVLSDLMLILPLAFFLAILLALGRMYKDSEITAFAACGVAVPVRSIIGLGVVFAGFIAVLSLWLAPWAEQQIAYFKTEANNSAEINGIAAGRFKEFAGGQGVVYVESFEGEKSAQMENVFVQAHTREKRLVIRAETGQQIAKNDDAYMRLTQGTRYENTHGQLDYTVTTFAEHEIKIPKRLKHTADHQREALPTMDLLNQTNPIYQAELQWRLSLPLSVILLAALAVPLSRTNPRQGQYAKLFTGILIYLIYNNILNVAQKWVMRGDVPTWLGMWWVHVLLVVMILLFSYFPQIKHYFTLKFKHQSQAYS